MGWHMNALRLSAASLVLALLLAPVRLLGATSATTQPTNQPAAIVPLVGQIDDYSRDDFIRRFDRARAMGARVVIVSINSPGGLVTASMDISRYLKRQDDV